MSRKNTLSGAPPYAVEETIKRLGANLRTARLRRNLTIQQVADKIGTGPRAVMEAEKGRPGASIAVYLALLWAYDLLDQMSDVADAVKDAEGLARLPARERARTSRLKTRVSNDF